MTDTADGGAISLQTMRAWTSELEQLGAAGDLGLLHQVTEQRQRQEEGDPTKRLSPEQIGLIEGLTGIKVAYDSPASPSSVQS